MESIAESLAVAALAIALLFSKPDLTGGTTEEVVPDEPTTEEVVVEENIEWRFETENLSERDDVGFTIGLTDEQRKEARLANVYVFCVLPNEKCDYICYVEKDIALDENDEYHLDGNKLVDVYSVEGRREVVRPYNCTEEGFDFCYAIMYDKDLNVVNGTVHVKKNPDGETYSVESVVVDEPDKYPDFQIDELVEIDLMQGDFIVTQSGGGIAPPDKWKDGGMAVVVIPVLKKDGSMDLYSHKPIAGDTDYYAVFEVKDAAGNSHMSGNVKLK